MLLDYAIIALGNPGDHFVTTRHNVGWIVLDQILGEQPWQYHKYAQGVLLFDDMLPLVYAKPMTMMNLSGITAQYLKEAYQLLREQFIIIYDDIDLPLGKVKISHNRGNGGHNGIRSLEDHLKGSDFTRIRIGVSRELENGKVIKPNVLGNFSDEERKVITETVIPQVKQALNIIMQKGRESAMNMLN